MTVADLAKELTGSVDLVTSLDMAGFRDVLGHFVTGVVVVSAQAPDGPAGFTCQTFGSLSLEPMLVSFSANAASRSWPRVRQSTTIGINVLAEGQEALARAFSTSGVDKFEGVEWSRAPGGAPFLAGALAHLEGRVVSLARHGDHDLVVVAIDFAERSDGTPLSYYRGDYRRLA